MKHVQATDHGYDGVQVRPKGEKFHIRDEAFDAAWMKDISAGEPAKPAAPASEEQAAAASDAAPSESSEPVKKGGRKKKG